MGRTVLFGSKPLVGPIATHWAIKVEDTWYEVPGTSPKNKGDANTIEESKGYKSKSGATPTPVKNAPSLREASNKMEKEIKMSKPSPSRLDGLKNEARQVSA